MMYTAAPYAANVVVSVYSHGGTVYAYLRARTKRTSTNERLVQKPHNRGSAGSADGVL